MKKIKILILTITLVIVGYAGQVKAFNLDDKPVQVCINPRYIPDFAGIAVDPASGNMYVVNSTNYIYKVSPTGEVSDFVIVPNTPRRTFQDIVIDSNAKNLYVTDLLNHTVLRVDIATKQVLVIAGKSTFPGDRDGFNLPDNEAELRLPFGIGIDQNDVLYISDQWEGKIRKIVRWFNSDIYVVSTVIGTYTGRTVPSKDGPINQAVVLPVDIAPDALTGNLYFTERALGSKSVRKFDSSNVSTMFMPIEGTFIARDNAGNLFTAGSNYQVLKISPNGSVLATIGKGGKGFEDGSETEARFQSMVGVAVDNSGVVYITEHIDPLAPSPGYSSIRKITPVFNPSSNSTIYHVSTICLH